MVVDGAIGPGRYDNTTCKESRIASLPVTLILPTHDRRHVLARTVACYRALAERMPVIVIDDASRDGSAAWLRAQGLTVVGSPRRLYQPGARNLGLHLARTPWVLFGEDDVVFAPGHVDQLLADARRLPHCAAIGGRLHAVDAWDLPAAEPAPSAGPLLDPRLHLGDFAAAGATPRPVPSLHAVSLVDRAAALACGGYDTAFAGSGAFREESEFYARLWRAGHACWWTPSTWCIHVRHRLGGGARGRRGLLGKLGNRWRYIADNARYENRHAALWQRLAGGISPGRQKAAWTLRVVGKALAAWRG